MTRLAAQAPVESSGAFSRQRQGAGARASSYNETES